LEHSLRFVTLIVTAVLAMGASALLALQQPPAARQPAPPARRAATAAIGLVEPLQETGRVELWRNARLVAASATVAAPVRAPVQSFASGAVQDIITRAFTPLGPTAVAWGLRVARCESGYNPRAYNAAGPYYGLFQFLMSTFRATPYGTGDIYDPMVNANAAAWKYSQGGARAWGCN
jgi:hypothetical protein